MTYKETVETIKKRCMRGDVSLICQAVPVSTTIFYTACNKKDWGELTPREVLTINAALRYFKQRDEVAEQTKQMANEL